MPLPGTNELAAGPCHLRCIVAVTELAFGRDVQSQNRGIRLSSDLPEVERARRWAYQLELDAVVQIGLRRIQRLGGIGRSSDARSAGGPGAVRNLLLLDAKRADHSRPVGEVPTFEVVAKEARVRRCY